MAKSANLQIQYLKATTGTVPHEMFYELEFIYGSCDRVIASLERASHAMKNSMEMVPVVRYGRGLRIWYLYAPPHDGYKRQAVAPSEWLNRFIHSFNISTFELATY
jgi:hypothetical protein